MTKHLSLLATRLNSLAVFRGILQDPVISKLQDLLWISQQGEDLHQMVSIYSQFTSALYMENANLSLYVENLLLQDDNFYIKKKGAKEPISPSVENAVHAELALFQEISQLTSKDIKEAIGYHGFLPSWENSPCNLEQAYAKRIKNLSTTGYGLFATYNTFYFEEEEIKPVENPDIQEMDTLFGYERERNQVVKNTLSFIHGQEFNNLLLYGDAGTGKSSTIKSVVNHYSKAGLRLIEIKKKDLSSLNNLAEILAEIPLHFVVFIDDLSFTSGDDTFTSLKAILEGSVTGSRKNMAIYASSNRRHLVNESFNQRVGDHIHVNDTIQETTSLASRFGLTVYFSQPSKEEYLSIVDALADQYHLSLNKQELHSKAEVHALKRNGRSPRVAKQFIELAKMDMI